MKVIVERLAIGVLVVGFAVGTTTHTLLLVNRGWVVNPAAPSWVNIYWTALTVLDPLAAVLLLRSRNVGLILALAIMLSDVAINTYVSFGFAFAAGAPLQLQTLFFGFLLGAAGFLWRKAR